MEIGGDCRLYLGVFDMYYVYFGFDVFLFIWVVYVRGRHYVYVFLCFFFLNFIFYVSYFTYGTLIIDLYYEVIHGICLDRKSVV